MTLLLGGLGARPRPLYSAAVAVIVRGGDVVQSAAVGTLARHADLDGTPVGGDLAEAVREDTVFDLASITKIFVATTLLTLVDDGRLDLDEPVATWLPAFRSGERTAVTARGLLTHTAGLPAELDLARGWPDRPSRVDALLRTPLIHTPGTEFEYSCVGFLVAGLLAEAVTQRLLADLVRERVCEPLGLHDTGYLPSAVLRRRTAATEFQGALGRGLVHGEVHDEASWSIGGTGGNAGIFGTAADLARFGEVLRGAGRLLAPATATAMIRDHLPSTMDPGFRHGLGVRVDDPAFMGPLASSGAFGHTGFTGTSLVVDPSRDLVVVLLTNRVHPSREWSDVSELRRAIAELALR